MEEKIYNKIYYETHKDDINDEKKRPIYCKICDTYITKTNISTHKKTLKHNQNLEERVYNIHVLVELIENMEKQLEIIRKDLLKNKNI